jgi:hypothetical protein
LGLEKLYLRTHLAGCKNETEESTNCNLQFAKGVRDLTQVRHGTIFRAVPCRAKKKTHLHKHVVFVALGRHGAARCSTTCAVRAVPGSGFWFCEASHWMVLCHVT